MNSTRKVRRMENLSVYGTNKNGFTLIELLVVIFLIGLMTTLVFINVRRTYPEDERKAFFAKLNSLVQFGWQQALVTSKVHRMVFDIDENSVKLERATDKQGEYEPVETQYIETTLEWPSTLEIQQFFIERNPDEITALAGKQDRSVWFFIVPDGLTQEVTINILDYNDVNEREEPAQVSLVLNPFSAQFSIYDAFQTA